jgi:hypothetical protein
MKAAMSFLKTVAALFVDDGWLAATVVVWIVIGLVGLHILPWLSDWWGPLFTLGILVLLATSVLRAASIAARKRLNSLTR